MQCREHGFHPGQCTKILRGSEQLSLRTTTPEPMGYNKRSHATKNQCSQRNFVVVQLLSCVGLFATPWTVAHQATLSFTISQNLLKFVSLELMMPCKHLILCYPFLLLPSIFPSIRVFSNEADSLLLSHQGSSIFYLTGGSISSILFSSFDSNRNGQVKAFSYRK